MAINVGVDLKELVAFLGSPAGQADIAKGITAAEAIVTLVDPPAGLALTASLSVVLIALKYLGEAESIATVVEQVNVALKNPLGEIVKTGEPTTGFWQDTLFPK